MGSFKISVGSMKSEMGSLKSENSWTKPEPTSTDESLVSELKKYSSSSDFETHSLTPTSHNSLTPVTSLNSLTPVTSLSIPALKFEENADVEIQSPDYSLWESIFSDQLDGDFMICSPVRNMLSPQASNYNDNYNYARAMQGGQQSLVGCSPPRFSSPLGPHKGKVMSPLHRFFNSPNNQSMQVESHSLPALESLLDDNYDKEDDFVVFSPMKIPGGEGSTDCFDALTTMPELLDCLTTIPNSTRFCGSVVSDEASVHGSSRVSQESGSTYQGGSIAPQPLSQQLQQERQKEEQQEQQQHHLERQQQRQQPRRIQQQPQQLHQQNHNIQNTLMMPTVAPEQVKKTDR